MTSLILKTRKPRKRPLIYSVLEKHELKEESVNQDDVIYQIIEASIEMDTDESDFEVIPIHEYLES